MCGAIFLIRLRACIARHTLLENALNMCAEPLG